MLITLNDRTKPFSFKGDTRLLRVGLDLITVPGSARVLDSQGITDVVNGVLIEPISRKFPAIGLLRWLDVNGRVQGEELRLEFEQTDFYPTVGIISGFELWFRKGVTLNVTIEHGGDLVPLYSSGGVLQPPTSATATPTTVPSAIASTPILVANAARKGATVWNDSTATLYLDLDAEVSLINYAAKLGPGDYYEVPFGFTGALAGIWSAANGNALVREFV